MSQVPIRFLTGLALVALLACKGGGESTPPLPPTPVITSLNPSHGSPGTAVALMGSNLQGASAVSFNGHPAFSFSPAGATELDAVVPGDATTGPIQVNTPQGSVASAVFTVDAALPPTLASFTPTILATGSAVTLTGTHFVGTTQVLFGALDATTFTVQSDTQIQAIAPAGLKAGLLSVLSAGGKATSTLAYQVDTTAQAQVLLNGGFEQASPIAWQGDTGIIQPAPGATDPGVVPHGGTQFAWLGGYGADPAAPADRSDQIAQDLYIPAAIHAATATFYLKILTTETGSEARDTLTVAALNPSGATLGTLLTKSNLDAGAYKAYTVDLLPYRGQVVRLTFKSQEDAQNATSFLLDDVSVTLVATDATDLRPVVTGFTPPSGIAGEGRIVVSGGNFFGLTGMTIGGASATSSLRDGTSLSAAIPADAAVGSAPITLTNAQGTGASTSSFSVTFGAPVITGLNPTQGPVDTPVVISGLHLAYPGTTLTLQGQALALTSQGATQITFRVPPGATSGILLLTTPGGTASRAFTVNTASSTLDLHLERVQVTQSTQTLDNAVPLVAGKDGLIRAFVLANQTNTSAPAVQVTLLNNGVAMTGYPKLVAATRTGVPTSLDESSLASSWNLGVPGTDLTTPLGSGYSVLATVDPGNTLAEADKSNNSTLASLGGTTVPPFRTTIFPVALSTGTGNINSANREAWVARLAKMYPVTSVDVAVGATFTGSVSTLGSDGTGWSTLLNDLATKHQADGASGRYYFGALAVDYATGVAGLGYIPSSPSGGFSSRTALGWDKSGYRDGGNFPEVFAHETGHNMGCAHSPCPTTGSNVPSDIDPDYPYEGAAIGVWGYDTALGQLYSPLGFKDIMAYCSPDWVSDYTYRKILAFRGASAGFLAAGAEEAPLPEGQDEVRECLLVRGLLHADGRVELLPAFRTRALPTVPPGTGEYRLECLDARGLPLYASPVALMDLGCWPKGRERHFLLALPLASGLLDAISTLNILKDGRLEASQQALPSALAALAAPPEVQRLDRGAVRFTWDAALHPAVLVRDTDSGEVIAILEGGSRILPTPSQRFDLVLSDGVTGPTRHLELRD